MSEASVTAIVLAGGSGSRMGLSTPKQALDLLGEPVLAYSLRLFASFDFVEHIVVVLGDPSAYPDLSGYCQGTSLAIAKGGPTRQASVAEGLVCLAEGTGAVMVHDSARPLVSAGLVERLYGALDDHVDGVVPVLAEGDALKEVSSGMVLASRSKSGLFRVQTPQLFDKEPLQDALARSMAEGHGAEDCSEMLLSSGYRVRAVEGDRLNVKITFPEDLIICEQILRSRDAR